MASASSIVCSYSPDDEVILSRSHLAPRISLSLRSGELSASSTACRARFSPVAVALPRMATPPFFITVHTSAKSTLIWPVEVITSVIHFAAVARISSALANAFVKGRLPNCWRSLSLEIMRIVSTLSRIRSMPSCACFMRLRPS